jgi:hypothetical protein
MMLVPHCPAAVDNNPRLQNHTTNHNSCTQIVIGVAQAAITLSNSRGKHVTSNHRSAFRDDHRNLHGETH